jgi:hypothetical protein
VIDKLAELRLVLHEGRAQVYPVQHGIPFLGFRVYPTHRRLKRVKGIGFQRRFKALRADYAAGRIDFDTLNASVQGWVAHASHADTYGLRKAILAPAILPRRTADEGLADLRAHA